MQLHRITNQFIWYTIFGGLTFLGDLILLYAFNVLGFWYAYSIPLSFLVATSIHYLFSHSIVFKQSGYVSTSQYIKFIAITLTNAGLITLTVFVAVELFSAQLFPARVAAGVCLGFLGFFLNARYNFKTL